VYSAAGGPAIHSHLLIARWLLHLGVLGVFVTAGFPVPTPLPAADILIVLLGVHGEWPWLLVLAGVCGSLLGGTLLWGIGHKGGEALLHRYVKDRSRLHGHVAGWIHRHGFTSVLIGTLLPPPFPFLPLLVAAGALGVTRRQLLPALAIGRILRYGLEAGLAAVYGARILALWSAYLSGWSNLILWVFLGMLGIGILYGIWIFHRFLRQSKESGGKADSHAA